MIFFYKASALLFFTVMLSNISTAASLSSNELNEVQMKTAYQRLLKESPKKVVNKNSVKASPSMKVAYQRLLKENPQKVVIKKPVTVSPSMKAAYQRLLKESPKKVVNKTPIKTSTLALLNKPTQKPPNKFNKQLKVTATAYTSHVGQTDSTPNIAAWGDKLKPGMKAIAVSRDLLKVYGLKHKQKVRIKGLQGEYVVLDKMNKRWRKKIDIYMGKDRRKAVRWGRRKVEIYWTS